jgi:hypothetical protein
VRHAALALPALDLAPQPLGIDELDLVRLVHRRLEDGRGHEQGKIDQRPDRRGHGYAATAGGIARSKRVATMCDQPRLAMVGVRRRRNVDRPEPIGSDPPQGGGTVMAEHRLGAAAEDRGHPFALARETRSPDRVHAAPHGVQPPFRHAVLDGAQRVAELEQLEQGHDAVLPLREPPDPPREHLGIEVRHHVPKTPKARGAPRRWRGQVR